MQVITAVMSSWVQWPCHTWDVVFHITPLHPLAPNIFPAFSVMFLELWKGWCKCPIMTKHSVIIYLYPFSLLIHLLVCRLLKDIFTKVIVDLHAAVRSNSERLCLQNYSTWPQAGHNRQVLVCSLSKSTEQMVTGHLWDEPSVRWISGGLPFLPMASSWGRGPASTVRDTPTCIVVVWVAELKELAQRVWLLCGCEIKAPPPDACSWRSCNSWEDDSHPRLVYHSPVCVPLLPREWGQSPVVSCLARMWLIRLVLSFLVFFTLLSSSCNL